MNKKYYFSDENGNSYPESKEVKLGSILTEVSEKTISSGQHQILSSTTKGLVLQSEHFTKEVASKDNTGYKIVREGQIVLSPQNLWMGNVNYNSRFNIGIVSPSYKIFNISNDCDREYIATLIRTRKMLNEFANASEQGASIVRRNLDMGSFNLIPIPLPSISEQQKIAEFFSALDERIALTADKVKLLKEQKAGYLQQVFNRELVFTDDNGDTYADWEQKKLGDITVNSPKKHDPLKSKEEYRSVELENLNGGGSGRINGWFSSLDQKSNKNAFKAGDVLLGKLRPYLKKWARPDFDGVCSTEIWVLTGKNGVTNEFLYVLVQSPAVQKALIDITSGTKMPRADWKVVATTKVTLPSLPEQEKIAEFFSALDEQIELTENKLALLKEQKKGYLQGIFG